MLEMKKCAEGMVCRIIEQKKELEQDLNNVTTQTGRYALEKTLENKEKYLAQWSRELENCKREILKLENK